MRQPGIAYTSLTDQLLFNVYMIMRKVPSYTHKDFNGLNPINSSTFFEISRLLNEEQKLEAEQARKDKQKADRDRKKKGRK